MGAGVGGKANTASCLGGRLYKMSVRWRFFFLRPAVDDSSFVCVTVGQHGS